MKQTAVPAFCQGTAEAQRLAGRWNLHAQFPENNGVWIAARLNDGGGPETLYHSREAAIKDQISPEYACYLQIRPYPMRPDEAQDILDFHRLVYDAGFRGLDSETPQPIMPLEYGKGRRF